MRVSIRIFGAFSSIVYFALFVIAVATLNFDAYTGIKITPITQYVLFGAIETVNMEVKMLESYVTSKTKWLSAQECANRMDVSKGLVIREIEKGILPAMQVGSCRIYRVLESDLNEYMEARKTVPKDPCLEPTHS